MAARVSSPVPECTTRALVLPPLTSVRSPYDSNAPRCCSCAREATSVSRRLLECQGHRRGTRRPACNAISDGTARARARVAISDRLRDNLNRHCERRVRLIMSEWRTYVVLHTTPRLFTVSSLSLSLHPLPPSFWFPFFFLLSRRDGRAHHEKRSLARRVHQSLREPATTACRLPWRRTRASAKVRPHWVKAKASWWGSRLARQSMRAVLVPPSGAHYRSAAAISLFLPRTRVAAPCYARVSSLSPVVSFYPSRDRRYRVVRLSLASSPRLARSRTTYTQTRTIRALHIRDARFTFRTRPSSPANIIRGRLRIRVHFTCVCTRLCVWVRFAIRGSPGEFNVARG